MGRFGFFCLVMSFLAGVVLVIVGLTQDPMVVWEVIVGAIVVAMMATIAALLLMDGKKKTSRH